MTDASHDAMMQGFFGSPPKSTEKIYAYDGPKQWGKRFQQAAIAKGIDCRLFTNPAEVDEPTWVRLDQQGEWREKTKQAATVALSPSATEALWYDDKVAQYPILKKYLPPTHVFKQRKRALDYAASCEYPLVSKSAEGASAGNVRLLHTQDDAINEAMDAFGNGLPLKYGRKQKGYVYWQQFIPHDHDNRVCIIGNYYYGAKQYTRSGGWTASGSGKGEVFTQPNGTMEYASRVAREIGTSWMAFDILPSGHITEMSCSWGIGITKGAPVFHRETGECIGLAKDVIFDVAVDRFVRLIPANNNAPAAAETRHPDTH